MLPPKPTITGAKVTIKKEATADPLEDKECVRCKKKKSIRKSSKICADCEKELREAYEKEWLAASKSTEPIYINQPGDYSGDTWHIAAAMVLNPNVRLVITLQSSDPASKDMRRSGQAVAFYTAVGIAPERITTLPIGALPNPPKQATQEERHRFPVTKSRELAEEALKKKKIIAAVFSVYHSTSIVMKDMEYNGKLTTARLQEAFVRDFEKNFPNAAKVIQALVKKCGEKGPYVLVNMRFANYNLEHNITQDLYKTIVEQATALKIQVVRIGAYNPRDAYHVSDGQWMNALTEEVVDIYNLHPEVVLASGLANMQATAYFWLIQAQMPQCIGVIGGRSGSLDIAAFMEVRTLCWDIVRVDDPEYVRLSITSPQLMSLMHYNYQKTQEAKDLWYPITGEGLSSGVHHAVAAFLAGNPKGKHFMFCPVGDASSVTLQKIIVPQAQALAPQPIMGLPNLGMTCYFNAALQIFLRASRSRFPVELPPDNVSKLLVTLATQYDEIFKGKFPILPQYMVTKIFRILQTANVVPNSFYLQYDAGEVLEALLGCVAGFDTQLTLTRTLTFPPAQNWPNAQAGSNGQLLVENNQLFETERPHLLRLPLRGHDNTLDAVIHTEFTNHQVEPRRVTNGTVWAQVAPSRVACILHGYPVRQLIVQLGRFQLNGALEGKDVTADLQWSIDGDYFGSDDPIRYTLKAFIVHRANGKDWRSGHYIAYIEDNGKWYCANDAIVTEVAAAEVNTQKNKAYIYYFELS